MLYHLTSSLIISIWSYNELWILLVTLCINTDHMGQFSPWHDCCYPGALWHHGISSPGRGWTVTNDHTLTMYWDPPGDTMCQHWSYGTVQSLTWLLLPWCLVAPWHQQPWQGLNCHKWSHTDYALRSSWWHYVSTLITWDSSVPDMTAATLVPCGTMASAALAGAELSQMITHWLCTDWALRSSWWHYVSTLIIWDSSVPDMTAATLVPCGTMASADLTGAELSQMITHWLCTDWALRSSWWHYVSTLIIWDSSVPDMTAATLVPCGTMASAALAGAELSQMITHWLCTDWALRSSWWHYVSTLIIWDSSVPDMTAATRVPCGTMASAALAGAELSHMITHWLYTEHWDPDYILTEH